MTFTLYLQQVVKAGPLADDELKSTLQRLDDLLCFRLLSSVVPKQFSSVEVSNGRVICTVNDEYVVHLTVNGEDPAEHPWQVLSLRLLLRPNTHKDKSAVDGNDKEDDGVLPPIHVRRVVDVVMQRMTESPTPLVELHTIVHHLVVTLMMDILRGQAQTLRLIPASAPVPPGSAPLPLTVNYWNDHSTHPSLRIRIDPTSSLVVEHFPVIVDPITKAEPQFIVVPTSLSIENLLNQAIKFHSRKRIAEVAQKLRAHVTLAPSVDDTSGDYVAVTLFGGWRLVIGVDFATGKFVARDSSLPVDQISGLEESFNADSASIPEIASSLKIRAASHYVERITHAIPLEAFRTLPPINQPPNPITGVIAPTPPPVTPTQNVLHLRYPVLEPTVQYYLSVTIAPDLTPSFALLSINNNTNANSTNNTLIAPMSGPTPQSVFPISVAVKHPITGLNIFSAELACLTYLLERTYDKAVGGAVSIGAQRRAYLMIVSELSALGFPHQIASKRGKEEKDGVVINVTLPDPLPLAPALPFPSRVIPFTSFSLSPMYPLLYRLIFLFFFDYM